MNDLYEQRGRGPFRDYAVPPEEMLDVAAAVLRTKVVAVFVHRGTLTVLAKERSGKDAALDDYAPPFRSAAAVFVHRVPGNEGACRVEIHAVQRGPFHRGRIAWESEVPPLLDEAVARRGTTPIRKLD